MKKFIWFAVFFILSVPCFSISDQNAVRLLNKITYKEYLFETNGYIYIKINKDMSRDMSLDGAIRAAKEKAVKNIIDYKGQTANSFLYQSDSFSELTDSSFSYSSTMARSEGMITEMDILTNYRRLIENTDIERVFVYYKAKYQKIRGDQPAQFYLEANINKGVFTEGDSMKFEVTSAQKGYLTLVIADRNDKIYPLFPNQFNRDNIIYSETVFHLPTQKEVEASVEYAAYLNEGVSEAHEKAILIITQNPFSTFKITTVEELLARIVRIPRSDVEMIEIPYKIIK